jgi:hypothetical protein
MKIKLYAILALLLFLSFWSGRVRAITLTTVITQTPTTTAALTLSPTPAATPSPTETPNASKATYEQLTDVQKMVLTTTQWEITGVLSVITIISVAGGLSGVKIYNRISDAAKRAEKAQSTVTNLEVELDEIKTKMDQAKITFVQFQNGINQQIPETFKQAKAAQFAADQVLAASTQVREELKTTQADLKSFKAGVKGDVKELTRALLLVQLEERSIELYSDDPEEQARAKKTLKAMSAPEAAAQHPAFARRHAVALLGMYAVEFRDAEIMTWLEKNVQEDSSASVRSTAEHYIKKFGAAANPTA